tara:strand:+ start:38 stop:766 length:729 start_codon:yes stop_codon:yes gene_type:complete
MKRRGIPSREREAIVKAWGGKCAYCKSTREPFAIDHIVPVSDGGTCELENLCLACVQCNSMKSDVRLPEMHEGLLLGIAKRKAESVRRKMQKKFIVPHKKNNRGGGLRLPTECGGEWVFPYLENANKIVVLLEALLLKGMTEQVTSRGDLLPDLVTIRSEVLNKEFFDGIGISYDEACRLFCGVYYESLKDAGWGMSGLNCSGTRNGDKHVIQFHKPKDEILRFLCFVRLSIVVYGKNHNEG